MSYSVIYLENHKCKICEAISRNVIEPVAVFVPDGEKENLKSELEDLNSEQLEDRLKEYYQNIKGKTQTEIPDTNSYTYQTCIFHCEKENEIWMKNFNEGYEEYAKRRDKAIQEGRPFDEEFEIKWNEDLVEEFWRRIRAYRFAVSYKEKWDEFEGTEEEKWKQLKKQLSEETQEEIEKNKDLILFNLKNLKIDKIFYDCNFFIFPKFQEYEWSELFYMNFKTSNFFYYYEKKEFIYEANFILSKFYDRTNFEECNFYEKTDFNNSQFHNYVSFELSQFYREIVFFSSKFQNNINFNNTNFFGEATYEYAQFYKKVNFDEVNFYNDIYFTFSQFYDEVSFWDVSLYKRAFFWGTKFYSEVNFHFNYKNLLLLFDLSLIQLSENSKVVIKNLKTYRLAINDINNKSEYFFFYNTKIIHLEEYKNFTKDIQINGEILTIETFEGIGTTAEFSPNLEIVNSHLNQMKFINCDFSKANHIKIESSDLTETKFINTDWGDISEKRICPDLFKENPKKARDVYRQLKLTLDNHKDYFSANGFYTLEMKAQERILEKTLGCKKEKDNIFQDLKILGKLLWKYRKLPKEKYELLVLKIHKLSSDFGQSWAKPLLWIISSALTFTVIRFLHKKNFPYNILPEQIGKPLDTVATFLNEFAKSLIPLFANKKEVHGLEFISLLFSIIIGFFVYQFIVAVRRKVKR